MNNPIKNLKNSLQEDISYYKIRKLGLDEDKDKKFEKDIKTINNKIARMSKLEKNNMDFSKLLKEVHILKKSLQDWIIS